MFVHDTLVQAQFADALALVRKTRSLSFPSLRTLSAAWLRRREHAPNFENCNDD
jgi:hypothetical protein